MFFFVGENGTGKTTAMINFLKANERNLVFPASMHDKAWRAYPTVKPVRAVVDDLNTRPGYEKKKYVYRIPDLNKFTGTRVVDTSDLENDDEVIDLFFSVISERGGFLKGGLFTDDFKTYVKADGNLPHKIKKLVIAYRHRELDLFFACHSFNEINAKFFGHNPIFYLFKTDSPPNKTHQDHYNRSAELMQYYNHVQEMAKTNLHYALRFPPLNEVAKVEGADPMPGPAPKAGAPSVKSKKGGKP